MQSQEFKFVHFFFLSIQLIVRFKAEALNDASKGPITSIEPRLPSGGDRCLRLLLLDRNEPNPTEINPICSDFKSPIVLGFLSFERS